MNLVEQMITDRMTALINRVDEISMEFIGNTQF